MTECTCRTCTKTYDEHKSRAEYKGYCSAKCLHTMAKRCGYKKGKNSEYDVLKRAKQIGSVKNIG